MLTNERDEEVEAGTGVLFIEEIPRYKSYSCSESDDEDDKDDDHAEFQNVEEDKEDESKTTGFMPWSFDEPTFCLDQGKSKRQKWTTSQARLSIINELKFISSPAHEKEEDEWEKNYFYEVSTCIFGASVLFCRPYNRALYSFRNMQPNGLQGNHYQDQSHEFGVKKGKAIEKREKIEPWTNQKKRSKGWLRMYSIRMDGSASDLMQEELWQSDSRADDSTNDVPCHHRPPIPYRCTFVNSRRSKHWPSARSVSSSHYHQ